MVFIAVLTPPVLASWGGGLRHCVRLYHVVSDTDRLHNLAISLVPIALSSDWVPIILFFVLVRLFVPQFYGCSL